MRSQVPVVPTWSAAALGRRESETRGHLPPSASLSAATGGTFDSASVQPHLLSLTRAFSNRPIPYVRSVKET